MKLDNKKIFLIVLIAVSILYIDYSFIIRMQLNNIKSLKSRIIKLKQDINTLNKQLADIDNLKIKLGQSKAAKKQIISEGELPTLLEDIANIANKNNIRITQIKPSKEIKAKGEKVLPSTELTVIYIILDLSGSYHNFGNFINELENADKFIAVENIKIARDTKDYLRQNVNLLLRTYVKK